MDNCFQGQELNIHAFLAGGASSFPIRSFRSLKELNVHPVLVNVREVGCYFVHGNLEGDGANVDFESNRELLRRLTVKSLAGSPINVKFHLDDGSRSITV